MARQTMSSAVKLFQPIKKYACSEQLQEVKGFVLHNVQQGMLSFKIKKGIFNQMTGSA